MNGYLNGQVCQCNLKWARHHRNSHIYYGSQAYECLWCGFPLSTDYYNKHMKWDLRFLDLAKYISGWSRDPSTQTGAVIIDKNKRIVSTGYNGFPKGIKDTEEDYENRELKYLKTVHCETNSILFAQRDLSGCSLFTWPFLSCSRCCVNVIQVGISRVIAPTLPPHLEERWGKDINLSRNMFAEAGVEVVEFT